jgi:beta-lactamase superfamily II metal-dependent hydrolase
VNCEIEFLAVGTGSKAGDAIVIRYGEPLAYHLMLIDGGTAETGATIVSHLRRHFGSNAVLEHVVLTHSDADHASGLRTVLEEIPVRNLWLHIPWMLAPRARLLFTSKNWTDDGLARAVRDKYDIVSQIVDLGVQKGCTFYYPFQGSRVGPFHILSPSEWAYLYLLPQFEPTPDPDQAAIEGAQMWIGKATLLSRAIDAARAQVHRWTQETWAYERLRDGGITSASNESSVILYGDFGDNKRVLLTGDAGIRSLAWAAQYAASAGLVLQQFSFVQIPHHGSRRNVGPTVLNQLLGPIQPEGFPARFKAFVSAPADDDKHPRKIVLNAFTRRGGDVIVTQGQHKVHCDGFGVRDGYVTAYPTPFSPNVEDYD